MTTRERGPSQIVVQAFVQATEDEEKVKTAILNLFSENLHDSLTLERKRLRGHYHNPIIHLEARLTRHAMVKQAILSLSQRLSNEERQQLRDTFDSRVDRKGQLFLRFDKQESYQGRLHIINQGDSLRFMIRFAGPKQTLIEMQSHCRELNLI